jgi:hypothetical protein
LRYARYDLVCIDELGYVPLAELGTELLFQVISERAEKASVMITTNLPFSEWTKVFTNARLCKAMLDRLTDRAHIIETGKDSFRFLRTMQRRTGGVVVPEASRYASRVDDTFARADASQSAEPSRYASGDDNVEEPGAQRESDEASRVADPAPFEDASRGKG